MFEIQQHQQSKLGPMLQIGILSLAKLPRIRAWPGSELHIPVPQTLHAMDTSTVLVYDNFSIRSYSAGAEAERTQLGSYVSVRGDSSGGNSKDGSFPT